MIRHFDYNGLLKNYRNPYRQMHFRAQISPKSVFGRGSAPDPAGGVCDAPPYPVVDWGGGQSAVFPSPLTLSASRSRRLLRLAFQWGPRVVKCVYRVHQMVNLALMRYVVGSTYWEVLTVVRRCLAGIRNPSVFCWIWEALQRFKRSLHNQARIASGFDGLDRTPSAGASRPMTPVAKLFIQLCTRTYMCKAFNQSINQSKHIYIVPCVASESEAHCDRD